MNPGPFSDSDRRYEAIPPERLGGTPESAAEYCGRQRQQHQRRGRKERQWLVYQLVITTPNWTLAATPPTSSAHPDGATQTPPSAYTPVTMPYTPGTNGQVLAVVDLSGGGTVTNVSPVGQAQSGTAGPPMAPSTSVTGFLVVGGPNPAGTTGPAAPPQGMGTQTQIQTTVTANNMNITVQNPQLGRPAINCRRRRRFMLQRLANPNLPYQPNPRPRRRLPRPIILMSPWITPI